MKYLLIGLGSRGDVQPLIALAKGMIAAGLDTTIAAGFNFQTWVESHEIPFEAFGVDMHAMMNSDHGKEWVENSSDSSMREGQNMRRMVEAYGQQISDETWRIVQNYDVLISGLVTFSLCASIAEKTGKRHLHIQYAPLIPTRIAASTMVPMVPFDGIPNRWSGMIGMYFMWYIFQSGTHYLRQKINLPPMNFRQFMREWTTMPVICGASPLLVPQAPDWHDQIAVTGFWFLEEQNQWTPPQTLLDFLAAGTAPVYIGFGSMANKNPEATTHLMIEALQQSGQRGIIYSGWGGLRASDLPESIYLLDGAPHDWLFPRMAAVVHHGGAGTTAAALRAGVPSTVISHMADQPYWGRRIQQLGAGTPFIRRHKLTRDKLASAIHGMTSDRGMQVRAAQIGEQIRAEDGVGNAVRAIQKMTVK